LDCFCDGKLFPFSFPESNRKVEGIILIYLWSIFVWLLTLSIGYVLGRGVIRLFFKRLTDHPMISIFYLPLGLGFLAYPIFLLGVLGLFYWWTIVILFTICIIVFWKSLLSLWQEIYHSEKDHFSMVKFNLDFDSFLKVVLCLLVILNFIGTFSPVIVTDALRLHLAVPKIYSQNHELIAIPFILQSNLPALHLMWNTLLLLLKAPLAATLIHFSFGLMILVFIYRYTLPIWGRSAALLAMNMFYGIHEICGLSIVPYSDLFLVLYASLALYTLIEYRNSNENNWLIICAILSGFAAASKFNGMIVALLIGCFLAGILLVYYGTKFKPILVGLIKYGFILFITLCPWFVKSYLDYGNPVWPFFYGIFGGEYWSIEIASDWRYSAGWSGLIRNLSSFIMIPWDISIKSNYGGGDIGPLFLILFPLILFMKNQKKEVRIYLLFSLFYIIIWYIYSQRVRHILLLLPILSIYLSGSFFSYKPYQCIFYITNIIIRKIILNMVFCHHIFIVKPICFHNICNQ